MDEFTKELEELGHAKAPNGRCTARYRNEPQRVEGPRNLPVWCDLSAGHEGPHRHVTGHRSFIMDRESLIEMVPLPEVCKSCGTKWPCREAEMLTKAFTIGKVKGRVMGRNEALDGVFQINGPSRAIARLREKYAADAIRQAAAQPVDHIVEAHAMVAQPTEVCEYAPEKEPFCIGYRSPCGYTSFDVKDFKYCPVCGKPVKVRGE